MLTWDDWAAAAPRFWSKVTQAGDCWEWTAYKWNGYGAFGFGTTRGQTHRAHRWAYEYMVGPIPDGLVIDHLCMNRSCVNPDHMDPVPQSVNAARGNSGPNHHGGKTHCKRGHPFSPENTGRDARGDRYCRTCMKMHNRRWSREYRRKLAGDNAKSA